MGMGSSFDDEELEDEELDEDADEADDEDDEELDSSSSSSSSSSSWFEFADGAPVRVCAQAANGMNCVARNKANHRDCRMGPFPPIASARMFGVSIGWWLITTAHTARSSSSSVCAPFWYTHGLQDSGRFYHRDENDVQNSPSLLRLRASPRTRSFALSLRHRDHFGGGLRAIF